MKKSVMKKWVKALRSGYYKQGKIVLKKDNKFCCLGVLCNISKLEKWDNVNSYGGCSSGLPDSVLQWSGINDSFGHFKKGELLALYQYNDGQDLSFKEIADIIEKNYKDL